MPTINDIQEEILTTIAASAELPAIEVLTENEQQTLGNVTSESRVGILRKIIYVVATAIWAVRQFFAIYTTDLEERIAASKPFTYKWYVATARAYQHGFTLDDFGDYINGTATDVQIAASKIVAQVAFERVTIQGYGVLRCKVAKEVSGNLVPLSVNELQGFNVYMNRKTAFGLRVIGISRAHDSLVLSLRVWYDPLILNSNGERKDGTANTPIIDAVKAYLKSLTFNGELVLTHLTDALQKVDGVKIPKILTAQNSWSGLSMESQLTEYIGPIEETRVAYSGYMRLDTVLTTIEYIARP